MKRFLFVCIALGLAASASAESPTSGKDGPQLKLGRIGRLHGTLEPAPVWTHPHLPFGGELVIDDPIIAEQFYAVLLDNVFARELGPRTATLIASGLRCEEKQGAHPEDPTAPSCQTLVDGKLTPVRATTATDLVKLLHWLSLPLVAETKESLRWQFHFIRCTKTVVDPPEGREIPSLTYACRFRIPSDREVTTP